MRTLNSILAEPIRNFRPNQQNRIVFSTEARGLANLARKDNKPTKDQQEQAEIMSVAMAQPHRRIAQGSIAEATQAGSAYSRLSEPLGRFCADYCKAKGYFETGQRYAEIVGQAKTAQGFTVPGWTPGDYGYERLTEEQIEAKKELALMRLRDANEILISIMPRAPRVMEKLCFDQLEPSIYDKSLIINCLYKIGVSFGLVDPVRASEADESMNARAS